MSRMKEYKTWVEAVVQKFEQEKEIHPDDALDIACQKDLLRDYLEGTSSDEMVRLLARSQRVRDLFLKMEN